MSENGIRNVRELGATKTIVLGLQHMFAMFGATVLVPVLTGLSVSATLLFAGVGTLLFHLLTKRKVPAFLGSSFAFLIGYQTIAPNKEAHLLPYACLGVFCAGLLYLLVSVLFKFFGAKKVMRFFPPIVTGPIILCIGITLSNSAINRCSENWWIALVAVGIVIVCNIWGKGMIRIIPILLGVAGSYLVAALTNHVDFTAVREAAWIGLPVQYSDTVFSLLGHADPALAITAISTMVPIALATMVEHIGDISAISSTVDDNFIEDPGLHRTLLGDGLATSLAALFGAPANTTYGENTGVLALTRVYDPFVVRLAAVFAILFSLSPKFSALINSMPAATIGGISLILYGMISAIGVRNVVENQVDFSQSRNIIISALIMSLSLGIHFSDAGSIIFSLFGIQIKLTGLAVGSLVGILLNAILPGGEYDFATQHKSGKYAGKK